MPSQFWNIAASEPKRQHRFIVNFPSLVSANGEYQKYLAKAATKPGFTVSTTEHKFLGNTYYYPGTVTWDEVTITLINSITPDGNELFYEALIGSGYLRPNEQGDAFQLGEPVGTINKFDALGALGGVTIREVDGSGFAVGDWELKNAFITGVKFGDLDYTSGDLLNIEVTIRYDWATYSIGSGALIDANA